MSYFNYENLQIFNVNRNNYIKMGTLANTGLLKTIAGEIEYKTMRLGET